MAPRRPLDEQQQPPPRKGDPQWGAGGAATVADSMSFGFGPEVLNWLTGVPEDEVRDDINAFHEEAPWTAGAIDWGPVVAGVGGLAVKGGKKVLGKVFEKMDERAYFRRPPSKADQRILDTPDSALTPDGRALKRSLQQQHGTTTAAAKPPLDPAEIKAQALAKQALKEPTSGLPPSAKSDVRADLLRAADDNNPIGRAMIRRADSDGNFIRGVGAAIIAPRAATMGYQFADELSGDASVRRKGERAMSDEQSRMSRKRPRR